MHKRTLSTYKRNTIRHSMICTRAEPGNRMGWELCNKKYVKTRTTYSSQEMDNGKIPAIPHNSSGSSVNILVE